MLAIMVSSINQNGNNPDGCPEEDAPPLLAADFFVGGCREAGFMVKRLVLRRPFGHGRKPRAPAGA
jgi:hypothetical protein